MEVRKMLVLNKRGDEIYIIFHPREENLRVGDCLDVGGIVTQVVDIEYANLPGIIDHMLRKSMISEAEIEQKMQEDLKDFADTLTDHKLAITKIRGTLRDGTFKPGFQELFINRSTTEPKVLTSHETLDMLDLEMKYPAEFGKLLARSQADFNMDLYQIGINLVTGMKGSGKSYASKKILLKLIENQKVVIVFDLNGEYLNLWKGVEEEYSPYSEHILILDQGITNTTGRSRPLRVPLSEISYEDFADYVNINRESKYFGDLIRIWTQLTRPFCLDDLEEQVTADTRMHEASKLALLNRIEYAGSIGLFGRCEILNIIKDFEGKGGAIIINLKHSKRMVREILVNFIVRKITRYRQKNEIKPLAIFAEEAQLYVSERLWDDLLTRRRHYGIFPTFITNDPRSLPDTVFSLCDNLISFRFHNQDDLKQIAKAKVIDETTLTILRNIENRQCIIVGDLTNNFPLLMEVKPEEDIQMGGETQRLFD